MTSVGPGTPCGDYLAALLAPGHRVRCVDRPSQKHQGVGRRACGISGMAAATLACWNCTAPTGAPSLEYGQIESNGIRCCYHGWLFGVDGEILDTPGEPPESTFKERLCHGAYPVIEYKGLVFTYMGPAGVAALLSPCTTSFKDVPGYCLGKPGREYWPCNWPSGKGQLHGPSPYCLPPIPLSSATASPRPSRSSANWTSWRPPSG